MLTGLIGFWIASANDAIFRDRLLFLYAFGMLPFGWQKTPKLKNNFFTAVFVIPFIGWGGWLFYIITRVSLAFVIGMYAGPFVAWKMVQRMRAATAVQQDIEVRSQAAGSGS